MGEGAARALSRHEQLRKSDPQALSLLYDVALWGTKLLTAFTRRGEAALRVVAVGGGANLCNPRIKEKCGLCLRAITQINNNLSLFGLVAGGFLKLR